MPLRARRIVTPLQQPNFRAPTVVQTALAKAGDSGNEDNSIPKPTLLSHITSLLNVFNDPACNARLLVLVIGQMLCSIATLIHDSYLPVYAQDVLGLNNTSIGAVQGLAQFLCQLTKGVSGVAGDLLGSQVRVLVFGTFMTLLCKPMFVMLSTVQGVFGATACLYWFFFAKLLDRMSKGIREAPTKAVMNELARESGDSPDAAYGLRQSLATAGMLLGSTIAALTFACTGHNYILTFAVAMVPPALALMWMVKNFRQELFGGGATRSMDLDSDAAGPAGGTAGPTARARPSGPKLSPLEKAKALFTAFKPVYWQALLVVAVLYMARFDASFLSLRAKSIMSKAALPMLTLTNTLIQVLLTAPLARFSGQSVANRNRVLLAGFAMMILADLCFGLDVMANPAGMFIGAAVLGLHMAMTHSITVSMIASYMPTGEVPGLGKLSGTAVSFTDLLLGFVLAASNTMAGVLSDYTRQAGYGNVGCFAGGAVACFLASVLLVAFTRFGDLGRDDLIVKKVKKPKAA